ncbi:MAG: dihydroorotase, partial [Clostridiales bacterium]|nr:dihydroorotase [Clostridiales bacterium]
FSYKETIKEGSLAAARGGYTAVCTMPNLNPVPDCLSNLNVQLDIIEKDSVIKIYPYGAITVSQKGETLSNLEELAPSVIAFSDDGKGVQSEELMRQAMLKSKSLGKIIVAHCEVNDLLNGGYIHEGDYAKAHGHRGICSESEWKQIERDVRLSKETGCAYHVCHVSCAKSVEIIREAKKNGVDVTCEVTPHHLLLDETMLEEDGNWKMNPPLRSVNDRLALIEGIKDGTIDMIATDHAPHSLEEKSRGLEHSAFGIVGIETAFPLLYTQLVKEDIITLDKLIGLIAIAPRERFNIPLGNDYTVWDLGARDIITDEKFLSKGKSMPWEGTEVCGICLATSSNGQLVYKL